MTKYFIEVGYERYEKRFEITYETYSRLDEILRGSDKLSGGITVRTNGGSLAINTKTVTFVNATKEDA